MKTYARMKLIANISISSSGDIFTFPAAWFMLPSRSACSSSSFSCCSKTAGFHRAELNMSGEGSETLLMLVLLVILGAVSMDIGKLPAGLICRHSSSKKGSKVVRTRVVFVSQARDVGEGRLKNSSVLLNMLLSISEFGCWLCAGL